MTLAARAEQVDLLHASLRFAVPSTLLLNLALFWVLSPDVPVVRLAVWIGLCSTIALSRSWMAHIYKRQPRSEPETTFWLKLFLVSLVAQSLVFGSAVWVIYPSTDPQLQLLLILMLVGTAAGGTVTLAAHLPSSLIFITLVLAPLGVFFVVNDDYPAIFTLLTVVFGGLLMSSSRDVTGILVRSLDLQREQDAVIAKQTKVQAALQESEERYRSLVEISPEASLIVGEDGKFQFANRVAAELYRANSPEDVVGRHQLGLVHPDDRGAVKERLGSALAAHETKAPLEFKSLRLDDTAFDSEGSIVPVLWEGRGAHQLVLRDITERKQLERTLAQTQKMEAVAHLTSGVAHDFNNLLQVISSNLHYLEDDLDEGSAQIKRVRLALNATLRGADITRGMLAYSHKGMLVPTRIDVGELVSNTVNLLRPMLGESIEIEAKVGGPATPVLADQSHLQAALINLAINARDAMPTGGALKITVARTLDDGGAQAPQPLEPAPEGQVVVAVHDTGSGMAPDLLDQVFDPFFTTKGRAQASGLGLSMVKGFVEQSGGHLEIESEVGLGTTVRLYLPESEVLAVGADKGDETLPTTGSETVLLVEDDAAVFDSLAFNLGWYGYNVITAEDGPKALSVLQGNSVDVLITDLVMPGGLGGIKLAQTVRKDHPELPVIFITGHTHEIGEIAGSREGDQMLHKPFGDDELAEAVRRACDSRDGAPVSAGQGKAKSREGAEL